VAKTAGHLPLYLPPEDDLCTLAWRLWAAIVQVRCVWCLAHKRDFCEVVHATFSHRQGLRYTSRFGWFLPCTIWSFVAVSDFSPLLCRMVELRVVSDRGCMAHACSTLNT